MVLGVRCLWILNYELRITNYESLHIKLYTLLKLLNFKL